VIKNKKKIIITGISGLLGSSLAHCFKNKYNILGLYNLHPINMKAVLTKKCDIISNSFLLKKIVEKFNPEVIIHCAALTDVDFCEINKKLASKINIFGTKIVSENCNIVGAKLIYISTDSVYDGVKGDFSEEDKVNPINYYGFTKYEGEREALKYSDSLVLRTNIFGWNVQAKNSLSEWILDNLINNRKIKCFKDAIFSSIYTIELAKIIGAIIDKVPSLKGVYNCSSRTSLSKHRFALKIADKFKLNRLLIEPSSIDEFNFRAKRAKNLSLDVGKLQKDLHCSLPAMGESINSFYSDSKNKFYNKNNIIRRLEK
jgi:dTDP-4-dehydrorhamnose reductase